MCEGVGPTPTQTQVSTICQGCVILSMLPAQLFLESEAGCRFRLEETRDAENDWVARCVAFLTGESCSNDNTCNASASISRCISAYRHALSAEAEI